MRILFITYYSSLYGANRSLLNLIDGLKQFKVESLVLCTSEGEITKALKEMEIPFAVYSFKNWMRSSSKLNIRTLVRLIINFILLPFIVIQVRKWNVNVIYTNSSVTQIGALIAIILKKPHIWHIREFGKLDYQLHYDWGRKAFKKWLNKADAVISISNAVI